MLTVNESLSLAVSSFNEDNWKNTLSQEYLHWLTYKSNFKSGYHPLN